MKKLTLAIPAESHKKLKVLAAQTEQTMVGILLECIDERWEEMAAANFKDQETKRKEIDRLGKEAFIRGASK